MRRRQDVDFLVNRMNLSDVRWARTQTRADGPIAEGEAVLRVDHYALTANNITYALLGDRLHYWDHFPAEAGWGRIPVWGHADVVMSRMPDLPEAQRVFGYLPMSPLLKIAPEQITSGGFRDASVHRRRLPAMYQAYMRTPREDAQHEDLRALLQPLASTGWLIDSWLIDNDLFGAQQVVLGSASSKTALGAAFLLGRRADREFEVIGLTAGKNRGFCERVGYYDRVVEYGEMRSLRAQTATVFVDMSGAAAVRRDVHEHFATALRYSCAVGLSHGTLSAPANLPGPAPQMFSATAQAEKCRAELGAADFEAQLQEAQAAFSASALTWLEVVRAGGPAATEAAYRNVLTGQVARIKA